MVNIVTWIGAGMLTRDSSGFSKQVKKEGGTLKNLDKRGRKKKKTGRRGSGG